MTDDCECVCNHSGACTGCGMCWVTAYYQSQRWQPFWPPPKVCRLLRGDPS